MSSDDNLPDLSGPLPLDFSKVEDSNRESEDWLNPGQVIRHRLKFCDGVQKRTCNSPNASVSSARSCEWNSGFLLDESVPSRGKPMRLLTGNHDVYRPVILRVDIGGV